MNLIGLFGVITGSAVALAFFLSSFFLFVKRKEDNRYLWLGLILLSVGLRVGKSIVYFLLNDMAPIGLAFGFLGLASIGPLTIFMMNTVKAINLKNGWHWIFPIAGAVTCFLISPSPYESVLYKTATGILFFYLIFSWVQLRKYTELELRRWYRNVLIMVTGIWMAFVFQHVADTMIDYAFGASIATVFIYWIFFQSLKASVLIRGASINLPDHTLQEVKDAFEDKKLFKKHGMNLQEFSICLETPPYLITRSVKKLYDRSFPETLNHFRVEEVKQMLLDPTKEHLKIESLAYDVGFTSPSAFYAAFKKFTGETPTAYQKKKKARLMTA